MSAISTAFLGLVIAGLYRLVRRVRERWVWWATAVTGVMILFVFMVQPVVLEPLFNDYQPLPAGEVRDSILALAQETKIPVDDVFWFDASKQTKRISANVSGLGGTARIALNDNLLHGTSLPEIRAVMGHEMGHYRLHHGLWLGARIHDRARDRLLRHQPAVRPNAAALRRPLGHPRPRRSRRAAARVRDLLGRDVPVSPVTHTMIRTAEHQADAFGLEVAKEPHGFASVAMRLSTYRKLEPGHSKKSSSSITRAAERGSSGQCIGSLNTRHPSSAPGAGDPAVARRTDFAGGTTSARSEEQTLARFGVPPARPRGRTSVAPLGPPGGGVLRASA